jgi:outer membrane protein TolC
MAGDRRARRVAGGVALACALAGAVGSMACSGMDAIDRRIDRVLGRASGGIGAMSPAVRRAGPASPGGDPYEERPGTINPSAEELPFEVASPERDVLASLESFYVPERPPAVLDLPAVFRTTQRTAPEYITAEEDYIFAVIRLLIERHLWGPRFFNDTTSRVGFDSVSGRYEAAVNVINDLRVTQRLPYGGDVEARLVTALSQEIVNASSDAYRSSTRLVLSADFPLLRDAGQIAREDLIQAEREVVYAARTFERFRREFLVDIARDYFDLVLLRANITNQENRLRSLERLFEQRQALVRAGRRAAFDARNVLQNVERSRDALASTRETYELAVDRFKVRLGLVVDREIEIAGVSILLPEPAVTLDQAARLALTYRLDFQNAQDRVQDRRRAVDNARNQLLPDLDVAASASFGTDDDEDDLRPNFDLDDTDYNVSVTFGLPLDREIERLRLRRAMIDVARAQRNLDQSRDNLIVDARRRVREIERARFSLGLQETAIEINRLRIEELEIKEAETTAQQQLDAQDELLQSLNDRDRAVRDLRVAVLEYLLDTGQLRVDDDGRFRPLAGMAESPPPQAPGAAPPPPGAPGPADPADPDADGDGAADDGI